MYNQSFLGWFICCCTWQWNARSDTEAVVSYFASGGWLVYFPLSFSSNNVVQLLILLFLWLKIDGFEQEKKIVVIAATNRKEDLDPALIRYQCFLCQILSLLIQLSNVLVLSRFDSMIFFNLPDQKNREEIVAQYAKQFKRHELVQLAAAMEGWAFITIKNY